MWMLCTPKTHVNAKALIGTQNCLSIPCLGAEAYEISAQWNQYPVCHRFGTTFDARAYIKQQNLHRTKNRTHSGVSGLIVNLRIINQSASLFAVGSPDEGRLVPLHAHGQVVASGQDERATLHRHLLARNGLVGRQGFVRCYGKMRGNAILWKSI